MAVFYKYEYTRIMKNIHPCLCRKGPHLYLGLGLLLLRGLGDLLYLLGLKMKTVTITIHHQVSPNNVSHLGERPLLGDGLLRLP